jgi:polysaccharide export outer membrane protein
MNNHLKKIILLPQRAMAGRICLSIISLLLASCATFPDWLPAPGPSRAQVKGGHDNETLGVVQLVEVNDAVARKLLAYRKQSLFSESFGTASAMDYAIGAGDVIEVSVWEAPPAMLFGSASDPRLGIATTRVTAFPEQMVNSAGTINVPFAGRILVAGHNPQWIEDEIVQRLKSKANQPQVLVRVTHNVTANVTVVGEVAASTRMPLTAKGELLLDALAAAGGVKQPVNKMTLQITRGDKLQSLPMEMVIRDPKQNIVLHPGDVITALYQPLSFTVLGATGKNEEINFEAQGISLAQALARAGGLNDLRADARSVFIFRFEDEAAVDWATTPKTTPEGKVPVIYEMDLRNPATFFVAQSFPVRNQDVLYVANAPGAELQKFLNIVTSVAYPAIFLRNSTR